MKFEYMIETLRYDITIEYLDRLGDAGWELAAVAHEPDNAFTRYYFKRQVPA